MFLFGFGERRAEEALWPEKSVMSRMKVDSSSQEFLSITNMSDLFSRQQQVISKNAEVYIISY